MLPRNRLTGPSQAFVVQEAHRPPAPVLRYVDQVVGQPSTSAITFRYSQGVFRRFDVDVLHVVDQNIDALLGARDAGTLRRLVATTLFAWNLRRHRIALVRTLNLSATPPGRRFERLAQRLLDEATITYVAFDRSTATPDPGRTVIIPHAHFRDRFVGYPRADQVDGRILCVGADPLPDSVANMFSVARETRVMHLSLRIAGAASERLQAALSAEADVNPDVASVRIEDLSDGARVQEIAAAELVVVPRVNGIEDLQLVYLALSLDRPVLTERTDAMAELADAVGDGWVYVSHGPVTARDVDAAFASIRDESREPQPDLRDRDLDTTREAYETVFRAAAREARAGAKDRRVRPLAVTAPLDGKDPRR